MAAERKTAIDERPLIILFENSLFLILGALVALIWVNSGAAGARSHQHFFGFQLKYLFVDAAPGEQEPAAAETEHPAEGQEPAHGHPIDIQFLINDVLMALFFAIAAKEVWESLLPGGALSSPRRAAMPLLATSGGVIGPALLYVAGAALFSDHPLIFKGWAIPCATDIAFSYLVARLVFGHGHPAIAFLLLLAIADDAAGLLIIAVAYPQAGTVQVGWLIVTVGAIGLALVMKQMRVHSFWWYLLIPGTIGWYSFFMAGIHPALSLVAIVPCMPHAKSDFGLYVTQQWNRHDTLNEFEHFWKNPVEVILGLFGLCNAGVQFSAVGTGTWLVLVGLIVGKPVGITLFTFVGDKIFRLQIPDGMNYRHIITLGCVAGIGFTVALFVCTAAFGADPQATTLLNSVKMGALLSFFAAVLSIVVAKALGVRRLRPGESLSSS